MKRGLSITMGLACILPMYAQETLISVSVEPKGAPYQVDGVMYSAPTSFTWPTGSKHVLEIMITCAGPPAAVCQTRYGPDSQQPWTVRQGEALTIVPGSPLVVVTADGRNTAYVGRAVVFDQVRIPFFEGGGGTPVPVNHPRNECLGDRPAGGRPGLVCVDDKCYRESVDLWLERNKQVTLNAVPHNGFVFRAWYTDAGAAPFIGKYTVRGPAMLNPRFEPAKRVVIATDPPELRVLVDRTEVITSNPQNYISSCSVNGLFDFAESSTHVLGAPSPQVDINGTEWVFDKWSNGGGQNMLYKAERTNIAETLTAKFVRGIRVSVGLPKGLKLIVDGRDTWPSYNFTWGAGTRHVITAPAEQIDENGRKYVFKRWSNGGATTQELTLSTTDFTGMQLRAEYEMLGMINVQSNAPVTIQVGEETCQTPCVLHRTTGTEVTVTAPQVVPLSEGSRLELQAFSGEGSGAKAVKFTADGSFLSATYKTTYRLSASADPANGATIRMEPAAPDSFYPANTRVQVYATSKLGYRFKRWVGDTADRFSPASVLVSGPLQLTAVLEAIPEISQAGVRNGAGETPIKAVAPGSVISIYGANLAPNMEVGPANPLTQTLSSVTVHVAGHILPLFFVAPEQINAQLPYDLPLDVHMLTIKSKGMPDVSTTFEATRNAPGLLTMQQENRVVAVVTRANDDPAVNADNPVKSGDVIDVFGTGFGPHRVAPPEGFGVSEAEGYRLSDTVNVIIGEQTIVPEYAGAATGKPGVVVVRFRIPPNASDQALTTFNVVVNGVASNAAVLPTAAAYARQDDELAQ